MFGKLNNRLCYQPCFLDVCMYGDVHAPGTKACVCVGLLLAANRHTQRHTGVLHSQDTAFIHLSLLNLNSSSFDCPSSSYCN